MPSNHANKTCKVCKHYHKTGFCATWGRYVLNASISCENFDERTSEVEITDTDPYLVSVIGKHNLKVNRVKITDKIIKGESKKITKDEITDMKIDLWEYNQKCCRPVKIKRVYKRKKKEPT